MSERHIALIVEDDRATAEDLAETLKSLGCDSVITDNKMDALSELQRRAFCLVLLDLEIKGEPDSIKGHLGHGNSLLREIRQTHAQHTGLCYWLPVLIVSGFAREVPAAVGVMKDGASDIIQKPLIVRDTSSKIRSALDRSGRTSHSLCGEKPSPRVSGAGKKVALVVTGSQNRRRTRVLVGGNPIDLTDSSLKLLLRLIVARMKNESVHKRSLGAREDQGFKGISLLRDSLKPALGEGIDIIDNDYHGNYKLAEDVLIGPCDTGKLENNGDSVIAGLSRELRRLVDLLPPKSEGNS